MSFATTVSRKIFGRFPAAHFMRKVVQFTGGLGTKEELATEKVLINCAAKVHKSLAAQAFELPPRFIRAMHQQYIRRVVEISEPD